MTNEDDTKSSGIHVHPLSAKDNEHTVPSANSNYQSLLFRPNIGYSAARRSRPQRPHIILPLDSRSPSCSPSPTLPSPSVSSPAVSLPGSPPSRGSSVCPPPEYSSPSPVSMDSPEPITFASPSSSQFFPSHSQLTPPRPTHSTLESHADDYGTSFRTEPLFPTETGRHALLGYPLLKSDAPTVIELPSPEPSEIVQDEPMLTNMSLPGSASDFEAPSISGGNRYPSYHYHSDPRAAHSTRKIEDWSMDPSFPACFTASSSPVLLPTTVFDSATNLRLTDPQSPSQITVPPSSTIPYTPHLLASKSDTPPMSSFSTTSNSPRLPTSPTSTVLSAATEPAISPLTFATPSFASPLLSYSHYNEPNASTSAAEYAAAIMDSSTWASDSATPVEWRMATFTEDDEIMDISQPLSATPSLAVGPSIRNLPISPHRTVLAKVKKMGGRVKRFFSRSSRDSLLSWNEIQREHRRMDVGMITAGESYSGLAIPEGEDGPPATANDTLAGVPNMAVRVFHPPMS